MAAGVLCLYWDDCSKGRIALHERNYIFQKCEISNSVSDQDSLIPDPTPEPAVKAEYQSGSGSRVLMIKYLKKLHLKKIRYFFDQNLQFTYPKASIKDVQATQATG